MEILKIGGTGSLSMNYQLLPPVVGGITQEEVARVLVEFSRVLQTGHERSDGPAVCEDPHGFSQEVSTEVLQRGRFGEEISQSRVRSALSLVLLGGKINIKHDLPHLLSNSAIQVAVVEDVFTSDFSSVTK